MEQPQKQRSSTAKFAIVLAGLVITAVLCTLSQQLLFGKTIIAVTSAVISAPVFMIWWLLWKSTK
ncbi:hypothetical protein L0337_15725 [candidate division KSB1 bacterium]|nr:hypothetical protein [candidate division KSB1 bacterium]